MKLLTWFSGEGLLLMLIHQQQLQCQPILVSRIPLLLQYFLRHVCLYLQFKSSRVCPQFESSRICLHLELGVPHSLHLIRRGSLLPYQRR
jgi:hypothetical protein